MDSRFCCVVFVPVLLTGFVLNHSLTVMTGNTDGWLLFVGLLAVSVLIINTQIFRAKAYKLVESSSQLAPYLFTNLLFASIWQFLFFNVAFSGLQILGLAVIVAANVLNVASPIVQKKWQPRKAVGSI